MYTFFKDPIIKKWKIKNRDVIISMREDRLKTIVKENGREYFVPNYDVVGIPKEILNEPEHLRTFLADCYATISQFDDGSYKVSISPRMKGGANIITNRELLWPEGIVPIKLGRDIHPDYRQNVIDAIRCWNKNTNFQFVEYNPQQHPDYVIIGEAISTCYSYVGRQGGEQHVRCDLDDADMDGIKFDTASLVHELGHV